MSNYSDSFYDDNNANSSWYKVFRLIPKQATVLDVGCSSGNFGSVLIEKLGCTVDGIELNKADAKTASKKLRNVYVKNIETDKLDDLPNSYDVIYFGDVIEHLVDPVAALKRIKMLLKPKGQIVFSIPNMAHVTVRLQLLRGKFDYTETGLLDKTHLHFYTVEEVGRVFGEAGYSIKKIDFTEKDYPDQLVKDYLKELGLTANKEFYKSMHEPHAAAFQIVGAAVVGVPKNVEREQFGPIDMFESYFTNSVKPLKKRIQHLEGVVNSLQSRNHDLETQLHNLKRHPIKTAGGLIKRKIKNRAKKS